MGRSWSSPTSTMPGARSTSGSSPAARRDWIAQPRWSPAGVLHFVAEPDGWMNLFRLAPTGGVERAHAPMEAEFAFPDWVFGLSNYAFAGDGTIVAVGRSGGRDRLYRIAADGTATPFDLPFSEIRTSASTAARPCSGRPPRTGRGPSIELDLATGADRACSAGRRRSRSTRPTRRSAELVEFPTDGERTAFGILYRPTSRSRARPGRRPPAAHRHEPRWPDRPGLDRLRGADPAVHEPRLRRARRRLRRLDRLRHAPTASGSRASGASSTWRTASPARAGWRPRGSSTARGWRSAAGAPAATRPCAPSPSATRSRPARATSGSAISRRSWRRRTSSSRATSTG